MMTKSEQAFVDLIAEENRKQREIIRELMREQKEIERYYQNLIIKLVQKDAC